MESRPTDIATADIAAYSQHEILALVFNNLDDTFLLVGKDLQIITTNDITREKIFQYYGVKITSQTCVLELVPPERQSYLAGIYKEVFDGAEKKTQTEVEVNGTTIFFEHQFKPAKDHNGEIIGALITSREITENKRAEKHLKETEERWRFALEGAKQGVWDWNMQTGEIFYSSSYKKLYGYDEYELKGRIEEWEIMIHPDDRRKIKDAINNHVTGPDPYSENIYRIKAKNGEYKWILARGMLIGKDRMIGTHTDITEQVKAEENYKVLFYSNPLPMWTYDMGTLKFLSVNNAAVNHYGYTKEEFLSMTIKDIRPEEDIADLEKLLEKRQDLGYIRSVWKHLKKNGEIIHVEVSTHVLNSQDQNTVIVVAHDITSKIAVEKELKKSNERFLLSSRATSDAIYDWDLITNELYWGESIQTLFGFHPKEVPVSMWINLIHPDDRERIDKSLLKILNGSILSNWKEEYRFAKADGTFSYVLDRGFIIRDNNGKPIRMIGSMQDITDLKYNEQILSLERYIFELSSDPNINFQFIVESLLKGLEDIHDDALTCVFLLKEDDTIEPFVAPRLPQEYCKKLQGLKTGPDEGSCGAAMSRKETIIVEDIDTHPLWEKYRVFAQLFHLKACWSLPIIHSSGKVMGSFAIYYKKVKGPSPEEYNLFNRIRNLLRILMEHHWSHTEIRMANERFDIMMKATHDLVWDWNLEKNTIYRDENGLENVYGVKDNRSIENIHQWLNRIHPDDFEKAEKMITDILQTKEQDIFEIEYRFRKDDGNYTYVYDRGKIIRDSEGKPVRMIGAAQDITERKHLEQELLSNELEKQKAINQASVDSQEQERTEIGKELHDNVNQVLTTTKLYLDLALSNNDLKDELIKKSNKNIMMVINEIRQLSRSLMDPTIGDLGLVDSLQDLVENINFTRKVHATIKAERRLEFFLNRNHKLTIFRIVQEALNNSIKYARASDVFISCKLKGENAEVVIEDNGIGFDPALVKKGAGLKNIQNRVYLVNGTCKIESAPKKGCKITINFPLLK